MEELDAAQQAARAILFDVDALVARAFADVVARAAAGSGEPAASGGVNEELAAFVTKLEKDLKKKAEHDDVLEQAKISEKLGVALADLAAENENRKGDVAAVADRSEDIAARVDGVDARIAVLDDLDARISAEARRLVELLLKAHEADRAKDDDDDDRVTRDDVDDLALQLRSQAASIGDLFASKCSAAQLDAALNAKADTAALDAYASLSVQRELDDAVKKVVGDLGSDRRRAAHDLRRLKASLEALIADALAERDGVDGSAMTTQCLTCRRDVPETNGESAGPGKKEGGPRIAIPRFRGSVRRPGNPISRVYDRSRRDEWDNGPSREGESPTRSPAALGDFGSSGGGHRKLLPRLGTPPPPGDNRVRSPPGFDHDGRGDVYRGGFRMPLPSGGVDRPGTAPDARTESEFRDVKTVTMRRNSQMSSRPHTPQIMTIVEPLVTRPEPAGGSAMDGYAPPPGRHVDATFRNSGGRMEGHKLKSGKVVVPSTNQKRVNSLLSQAASLDTRALASIGGIAGAGKPPPQILGSSSTPFLNAPGQGAQK